MGVATVPGCFKGPICNLINGVVNKVVYFPIIQNTIGPAGYYRNPKDEVSYYLKSSFLPVLNNERDFNKTV